MQVPININKWDKKMVSETQIKKWLGSEQLFDARNGWYNIWDTIKLMTK